jgi:hypothetical protein
MVKSIWLFKDRVTINLGFFPQWDMSQMRLIDGHYNHWRLGDRCLDMTLRIWRFDFNVCIWNMPFQNGRYYPDDYDG